MILTSSSMGSAAPSTRSGAPPSAAIVCSTAALPAALHQTLPGVVRDDENSGVVQGGPSRGYLVKHIRTRLVFLQHALDAPDLPLYSLNRFSTERFSAPATWPPRFRPVCIRLFLLNATRTQSMRVPFLMLSAIRQHFSVSSFTRSTCSSLELGRLHAHVQLYRLNHPGLPVRPGGGSGCWMP